MGSIHRSHDYPILDYGGYWNLHRSNRMQMIYTYVGWALLVLVVFSPVWVIVSVAVLAGMCK